MHRGFALPILLVGLVLIGLTGGLYYYLQHKPTKTVAIASPSPSNKTLVSNTPNQTKTYSFDQTPDVDIKVVAGGFNFVDLTREIMKLNNPSVEIELGKQDWMFLQAETASKKTNTGSYDQNFHSLVAFAPPKNLSGKYDLKILIKDGTSIKKPLFVRVNVLSEPISRDIKLPPKNLKAALVGVGFDQSLQYRAPLIEKFFSDATNSQGTLNINFLGNVQKSVDDVWQNTDEIIDEFIKNQGDSTHYDLAIVYLNSDKYGGAPRTDSELKKLVICCDFTIFLHELIHLSTGIGDINYENSLLPPDPLHYSNSERSHLFSNPVLRSMGFEPRKYGVWVIPDEWSYKKISNKETYQIMIRNTGTVKDSFKLNLSTLSTEVSNVKKMPITWLNLNKDSVTLGPGDEEFVTLTIDPTSFDGSLYGLTVNTTSQGDNSFMDKANIYFETSK